MCYIYICICRPTCTLSYYTKCVWNMSYFYTYTAALCEKTDAMQWINETSITSSFYSGYKRIVQCLIKKNIITLNSCNSKVNHDFLVCSYIIILRNNALCWVPWSRFQKKTKVVCAWIESLNIDVTDHNNVGTHSQTYDLLSSCHFVHLNCLCNLISDSIIIISGT